MGNTNAQLKADVFNADRLSESIEILKVVLKNYPAIERLNYEFTNVPVTKEQIVGRNKSLDIDTMVKWGFINKEHRRNAYTLNTSKFLVMQAIILLLKS